MLVYRKLTEKNKSYKPTGSDKSEKIKVKHKEKGVKNQTT